MPWSNLVVLVAVLLSAALLPGCGDEPASPGLQTALTDADIKSRVATADGQEPASVFPAVVPLPDGFHPEGIAGGRGTTFYVGSIAGGAIYRGDLRTGEGELLVAPRPDRVAVGLSFDQRSACLFVAGGPLGSGHVYDTKTGVCLADFQFASGDVFINDVAVTRTAAWFTDSSRPVLYRVPLDAAGGLPQPAGFEVVPLGGDFTMTSDCPGFPFPINANGIDATADGASLVVVNMCLGTLYRVDPSTGMATSIDLGGESLPFGDGILLDGHTLYVVQNLLNQIAVVELAPDLASGRLAGSITSPLFRIPTTITGFGDRLYAVNGRFDVAPPMPPFDPTIEFDVVGTAKRAD
ncbi:MAG: superoxide dismutase [Candidatus Krumholzibacteriia bacterium]